MGTEFFAAFGAVLSIVIMITVGYFMSYKKIITKEISKFITWLILNISLPCLMASNILTSFKADEVSAIPKAVSVPLISILLCYGAGFIIVRLARADDKKSGQMIVQTAQNNTIFMGLPVNIAMLGVVSIPYVLYYYMANTVLFWTIGTYLISGGRNKKTDFSVLFSPALLGLVFGIIMLFLKINLPKFAMDTMSSLGALTTPLSMIFIGYSLFECGRNIRFDKNVAIGLISRFIIGPAISIAVFSLFNLPALMMNVFIIQSFMPVMANTAIVADKYEGDSKYAAVMISVSTIISLVLLPLVKILFIR